MSESIARLPPYHFVLGILCVLAAKDLALFRAMREELLCMRAHTRLMPDLKCMWQGKYPDGTTDKARFPY